MIYLKVSHDAASYMFDRENVNLILKYGLQTIAAECINELSKNLAAHLDGRRFPNSNNVMHAAKGKTPPMTVATEFINELSKNLGAHLAGRRFPNFNDVIDLHFSNPGQCGICKFSTS